MRLRLSALFAVLALLAGACASHKDEDLELDSKSAKKNAKTETSTEVEGSMPELKSQRLVPLAFGQDGFPRMKRYVAGNGADAHVERAEIDFNGDGRVDFIQYFDPTGSWVLKEAADLDGDGRMDVTAYYEKTLAAAAPQLVKQEFDTKYEGRPNLWKIYKDGKLARRELDRKGSGKPDYWEYYEDNRLVRIERDEDGDGSPDSQPGFKPVVKPKLPEPGPPPAPAPQPSL